MVVGAGCEYASARRDRISRTRLGLQQAKIQPQRAQRTQRNRKIEAYNLIGLCFFRIQFRAKFDLCFDLASISTRDE
jgi:hypothetical protein